MLERFRSKIYNMVKKKNPHAVALGRRGGLKGGKARAASMSAEERSHIARLAAQARWANVRKEQKIELEHEATWQNKDA